MTDAVAPTMRATLLVSVLGASFFGLSPGGASTPTPTAAPARECVRVAGPQIGSLLSLRLGGEKIQVNGWEATDITANALIGFRLEGSPRVTFTINAGEFAFEGSGAAWRNPDGLTGRRVRAIDAITFCTEQAVVLADADPTHTASDYD